MYKPLYTPEHIGGGMVGGHIISINVSVERGTRKTPVPECELTESGLEHDVHAGPWHRQVSLLAIEDIERMNRVLKGRRLVPGDFAENITCQGFELASLSVGELLRLGDAVVEVTQIGKRCHTECEIRQMVGDCIMPRRGVFARVVRPGMVRTGDPVERVETEAHGTLWEHS